MANTDKMSALWECKVWSEYVMSAKLKVTIDNNQTESM